MDKLIFDAISEELTPKINPVIAEGIVVEQIKGAERFIDHVWQCAATGFPPGLTYEGSMPCTPEEQLREMTRVRQNKHTYDIARSDVYMVKYFLAWQAPGSSTKVRLPPCYLLLPFVGEAGTIYIRDALYCISPVLADLAISVGNDSLFIPLTRDKLTMYRTTHCFLANGHNEAEYVAWSPIHHSYGKTPKRMRGEYANVDAYSTLVHYMLCKYGIKGMFKTFCNTDIHVEHDRVSSTEYDPSEWVICRSTGVRPRTVKGRGFGYQSPDMALVIPRVAYENYRGIRELIAGVFYLADHFPDKIDPAWSEYTQNWKLLLGHVIFNSSVSYGKLLEDIESHISSLDEYVDMMVQEAMADIGVNIDNIYQLFFNVIITFSDRLISTDPGSMYDKQLITLRYVLLDIVKAIFGLMFRLKSKTRKALTEADISAALKKEIKPEIIMRINTRHGEVSSIYTPGDNKIHKITSNMVPQADATGNGRNRARANINDPSKFKHASIAEVGSYGNLPKSCPDGRNRANLCMDVDTSGRVKRHEDLREIIDAAQAQLRRR